MNGRGGGVGRIELHSHRLLMEVHGELTQELKMHMLATHISINIKCPVEGTETSCPWGRKGGCELLVVAVTGLRVFDPLIQLLFFFKDAFTFVYFNHVQVCVFHVQQGLTPVYAFYRGQRSMSEPLS